MVLSNDDRLFRSNLLTVLREIRDALCESNKLSKDNYSRFDDEMAQLNEVHDEEKEHNKIITHELRELNRSVDDVEE